MWCEPQKGTKLLLSLEKMKLRTSNLADNRLTIGSPSLWITNHSLKTGRTTYHIRGLITNTSTSTSTCYYRSRPVITLKTNYSGDQFGLSLTKNWILIFLPSYMTFHYLQTDAIDNNETAVCWHAWFITLFAQTATRELCRVSHSHVAQPQELSGAIRKHKQILKLIFIISLTKLSMSAVEYL